METNPFLFGGVIALIVVLTSKKLRRLGDMAAGNFAVDESALKKIKSELKDNLINSINT